MHDLRDYNTLTAQQLTVAIGQLNHNTAPLDLRGKLAFGPEQLPPALRGLLQVAAHVLAGGLYGGDLGQGLLRVACITVVPPGAQRSGTMMRRP